MKKRIRKLTPDEYNVYNEKSQTLFRGEVFLIKRLLTEVHPKGILSVVSDTYDFWKLITVGLPQLKDIIMNRDGVFSSRPDSGNPVKIICGDSDYGVDSPQYKGLVECLWDIFGGTITSTNCRQLDSHISCLYGDSMNEEIMKEINQRLYDKRFASTNYLGGVGSFFFQYVTRDTFGSAVKATSCIVDGKMLPIYKDPKTDSGLKKSARGYLRVNADLTLSEDVTPEEENEGLLQIVFKDSDLFNQQTFTEVRNRLMSNLEG